MRAVSDVRICQCFTTVFLNHVSRRGVRGDKQIEMLPFSFFAVFVHYKSSIAFSLLSPEPKDVEIRQ